MGAVLKSYSSLHIAVTPFLLATPALCVGIMTANKQLPTHLTLCGASLFLLIAILWKIFRKSDAALLSLLFTALGFALESANITPQTVPINSRAEFVAQITAIPTPHGRYTQATAQIICAKDSNQTSWLPTPNQFCQVNIDTSQTIHIGQIICYRSKTYPFDSAYNNYYHNRNIVGRQYIYRLNTLGSDTTLSTRIALWRNNIATRIAGADTAHSQATAVMQALTVGVKSNLDYQTKQNYRASGTSHLLAISGLHIGIIFAILNFLLRGLNFVPNSHIFRSIAIILFLWGFAVISGMSPSVLRAVIMFSLFQIGMMLNRQNSINTLLVSAFILLVVNPNYLFDIGFQLSYLAMVGILTLFRPIYSLWCPRNKVLNALWQVTLVSFAAQIFTAPLVAYTFGQISVIGLGVNLIVWITTPVIIASTIVYIITPLYFIGLIGVATAAFQNTLMEYTGAIPWATIPTTGTSSTLCVVLYIILTSLSAIALWLYERKRYKMTHNSLLRQEIEDLQQG